MDFFSDGEEMIARAREVCSGCPVASECLEFARRCNPEFGVWAGKAARELRGHGPKAPRRPSLRHLICRYCSNEFRAPEAVYYCSADCRQAADLRRRELKKVG